MPITTTVKSKWMELQSRERVMLSAMFFVLFFLGLFVIYVLVSQSFEAGAAEIEQYRDALYYLEDHQGPYAKDKAEKAQLEDRLRNNDLMVGHYLSQTAEGLGFDVSVKPKDPRKASTADTSGAEEQEFELTIKSVQRDPLINYLYDIAKNQAPIIIRRMNIRRTRATGNGPDDTPLTVSMTVVSFKLKD